MERWFGDFSAGPFQPRVDVVDDGDAVRVTAELPGMDRQDIEATLEDDYLVLSGEKKIEKKTDEQGCYRVERSFGRFQRVIPLPEGLETERADAKFENGTLCIRLPKSKTARKEGRKLDIGQSSSAPTGKSQGSAQQG